MSPDETLNERLMTESELLHFLNRLAEDPAGMKFLRYLCHDLCTYHDTSATMEVGKVSINACLFNEGRKDIWRTLRPFFTAQFLGEIESFDVILQHERLMSVELKDEDDDTGEGEDHD